MRKDAMGWDWNSLGPLSVFLTAMGGGVVYVVNLVDRTKKEKRADLLQAAKEQIAHRDKLLDQKDAEIQRLRAELRRSNIERRAYVDQLEDAGIEPKPPWREPDYV